MIKEKLWFLRLEEDLDQEEEIRVEERPLAGESASVKTLPEGDLKQRLAHNRKRKMYRRLGILALVVLVAGGFTLYNQFYQFQDYVIGETWELEVASGTQYESAGKKLYRYNSDGVSCVTRKNDLEWSVTYNMQAPIADVCGATMAIAEQQGTQVYVVNQDGLMGSFETQLPILKVKVAKQGVVAVVLQDEEITWVNLYDAEGNAVASDKTTMSESGYPLDIDLSPDGQKLAVSYLAIEEGVMKSRVVFYHFGSAGQSKENNIVSSVDYPEEVIPQIYFTSDSRAVAVSDKGFYVFSGSSAPKQSAEAAFDAEIISTFHDEDRIGFLFRNTEGETEYRMELYDYKGKRKAAREIDSSFQEIKMENGQILMYSDKALQVYSKSGRLKFSSAYEKEVVEFFYFGEFRKYMVITNDSFDKIRIG